ncbi:hypothetical protein NQ318_007009 [Aromia moschata]|uniref:Fatty acyl-CoA reductase n=1 Tax=Aromia moschata TaxID=1265417 RepID=A0AAV8XI63_9CUCU|nr:hypothetical protein NQ318_007009 [Aromia moschata]
MSSKSPIANWYNDKCVFITGGSGFMGKVLVEKLLYSCSGIKSIYILLRSKRGKSPETRVQEMWNLPRSHHSFFESRYSDTVQEKMQRSLEQRMTIKFCLKLEKSAAETNPMLKKAFGVDFLLDRQIFR